VPGVSRETSGAGCRQDGGREVGLQGVLRLQRWAGAIAFPHVTKLYRFAPSAETVLDVREFHTDGLRPNDCTRADGFHELACYAEAVLVAAEYHAWARATSVEEYLAFRATEADFPVASHTKLAAYWNA
jgi:hypothetical protein